MYYADVYLFNFGGLDMKNLIKMFIAVSVMMFSIMPSMAFQFPDVSENHWASSQIDELSDKGVI